MAKAVSSAPGAPAPESASQLISSLLALPELRMRVLWLDDRMFARPLSTMASLLNEIAERAQSTDQRARDAMVAVAVFLAQKRDSALVWALREEAKSNALFGLERLLREPVDEHHPDIELEPRVPDYKTGRELSVGERRSLARRPSRAQIDRLLLDPHPLVLELLFQCPALTEDDVLKIAARRPARLIALEMLANSPRWLARRRVRLSLILNPGTPHGLALPLLTTCPRDDLMLVITSTNLNSTLRSVAHELYSRLPPIAPSLANLERH